MKERLKQFWNNHEKWFLIGVPLSALLLAATIWYVQESINESKTTTAEIPTESQVTFDLEKNEVYNSDDGIIIIDTFKLEESFQDKSLNTIYDTEPNKIWNNSEILSNENYTIPQEIKSEDGSIGTLSIPKIGLTAPVYETLHHGEEMESMTKGIAHFAITSAWDGNVGLSSHNVAPEGAVAYFGNLHFLKDGDLVKYTTSQGERKYKVTDVLEIEADNWDFLSRYDDELNRITMITCITGKPDKRLMVQATEK